MSTLASTIQKNDPISQALLEQLKQRLRGNLLLKGDDGYDQSRSLWNGMYDKHPALIIRAAGVSDVIQAVNFARTHQLTLAIKSGGHHMAGKSSCDQGLLLDMSPMKGILPDPKNKTVKVESGVLLGELDQETQTFGMAVPAGVVSHTGIAGLTLGGGQGWLMNKYGLSADNLLSADLVLADGSFVKASPEENPDLFWAIRGGGGNFGVVTSFEFRMNEVGQMLAGMLIYPLAEAREVMKFYARFAMETPDEMCVIAVLGSLPDVGKVVILAAGWCGELKEGEEVLKPLRNFKTPIADTIAPIRYVDLQKSFDTTFPHHQHYYGKMGYTTELSDSFIDTLITHFENFTSDNYYSMFNVMKGALTRVSPDATPFPYRRKQFYFDNLAAWQDPAENDLHFKAMRQLWKDLEPYTEGTAVNWLMEDDGNERVQQAYGDNYQRLSEIKRKYDPNNFFHMNKNILPAK
ncbi:FAD-binding oxidoreductase [Catalinimonas sp. 4WD22]|uniref:FAD-binding oxidoreductase n=1 Tax=Catalinimonas locisalis TaxID=3133978 RepID=UPI003100E0DE